VDVLDAFDIQLDEPAHISFVGGGGKTTTMFSLAHALKKSGLSVLVTTTTNIFYPDAGQCDEIIMDPSPSLSLFKGVRPGTVTCFGCGVFGEMKKVKSVDPDFLDLLFAENIFDHILVEADGAKRKPVKAPAEYEPVIPNSATRVIGIIGVDALGLFAEDVNVHRVERFCEITGIGRGETIDERVLSSLIEHPDGLFKGSPKKAVRTVILNKADTERLREQSKIIAGMVSPQAGVSSVISASMGQAGIYEIF